MITYLRPIRRRRYTLNGLILAVLAGLALAVLAGVLKAATGRDIGGPLAIAFGATGLFLFLFDLITRKRG